MATLRKEVKMKNDRSIEKNPSGNDLDLMALLPGYLERREQDLCRISELFKELNFIEIARIAHKMKGTGAGYGLPELSRLANQLERAAKSTDALAMAESIEKIEEIIDSEVNKLAIDSAS